MNQFKKAKSRMLEQGKDVEKITDLKTAGVKQEKQTNTEKNIEETKQTSIEATKDANTIENNVSIEKEISENPTSSAINNEEKTPAIEQEKPEVIENSALQIQADESTKETIAPKADDSLEKESEHESNSIPTVIKLNPEPVQKVPEETFIAEETKIEETNTVNVEQEVIVEQESIIEETPSLEKEEKTPIPILVEIPKVKETAINSGIPEQTKTIIKKEIVEQTITKEEEKIPESQIAKPEQEDNILQNQKILELLNKLSQEAQQTPNTQSKKDRPNIFSPKEEPKSMRKSLVLKPTSVKKAESYCNKNGGSFNELIQTLLDNFIEEYGL